MPKGPEKLVEYRERCRERCKEFLDGKHNRQQELMNGFISEIDRALETEICMSVFAQQGFLRFCFPEEMDGIHRQRICDEYMHVGWNSCITADEYDGCYRYLWLRKD